MCKIILNKKYSYAELEELTGEFIRESSGLSEMEVSLTLKGEKGRLWKKWYEEFYPIGQFCYRRYKSNLDDLSIIFPDTGEQIDGIIELKGKKEFIEVVNPFTIDEHKFRQYQASGKWTFINYLEQLLQEVAFPEYCKKVDEEIAKKIQKLNDGDYPKGAILLVPLDGNKIFEDEHFDCLKEFLRNKNYQHHFSEIVLIGRCSPTRMEKI
jgi:hypothetical protein